MTLTPKDSNQVICLSWMAFVCKATTQWGFGYCPLKSWDKNSLPVPSKPGEKWNQPLAGFSKQGCCHWTLSSRDAMACHREHSWYAPPGNRKVQENSILSLPRRHFHKMVWSWYWNHFPGGDSSLPLSKVSILSWLLKIISASFFFYNRLHRYSVPVLGTIFEW